MINETCTYIQNTAEEIYMFAYTYYERYDIKLDGS